MCSESELIALIKQRTGLELEALDSGSYGIKTFSMRFPDMETSQSIAMGYLNGNGTFFIDATNHFLCYTIGTGIGSYQYVDDLYRTIIFDFDGMLANVCMRTDCSWTQMMNIDMYSGNYIENDYSKNDITLVPLKVWACNHDNNSDNRKYVQGFIKNCYVNYERQFQRGLKFTDQNGNEFVTLGGYMLYYNGNINQK